MVSAIIIPVTATTIITEEDIQARKSSALQIEDVRKRRFDNRNRIRFPASISATFPGFPKITEGTAYATLPRHTIT